MDKRNRTASTMTKMSRPLLAPPLQLAAYPPPRSLERQVSSPRLQRAEAPEKNERRMLAPALIQRMEGEGNERKFTLSFSSEAPYARYWGVEILDHAPGAVAFCSTTTGTSWSGR